MRHSWSDGAANQRCFSEPGFRRGLLRLTATMLTTRTDSLSIQHVGSEKSWTNELAASGRRNVSPRSHARAPRVRVEFAGATAMDSYLRISARSA